MEKVEPTKTGQFCPICGKELVIRQGKYGTFTACSGYPECRYIQKEEKEEKEFIEGRVCPECGSPLIKRRSHSGNEFIGCSAFPRCHYIEKSETEKVTLSEEELKNAPLCPSCHKGHLVEKKSRFGTFLGCSNYPECRYIEKSLKRRRKMKKRIRVVGAGLAGCEAIYYLAKKGYDVEVFECKTKKKILLNTAIILVNWSVQTH